MKNKIIVALDRGELEKAKKLIDQLPETNFFKVGLEAYISAGRELIEYLVKKKKKVFLDLKFKDIPNTVAGAVRSSLKYNPEFLTIHLSGGREMLKRAVDTCSGTGTKIVGVSILTSLDKSDLEETGIRADTGTAVLKLIELGLKNGVTHFVCSPSEIVPVKERFQEKIKLITPGIRPAWASADDQKRFCTPKEALNSGADYLVIGRPVTASPDPKAAFVRILSEIT